MSYSRYPDYKNSGVEWLGFVPSQWTVGPLKYFYNITGGSTPKSDVETYWNGSIVWVTPADLSKISDFEIVDSERRITESGLNSCGASLVPIGSVVLATRAPIGTLGIAATPLCTNQGCKSLTPRSNQNPRFLAYALSISTEALNVRGRGTTFLELSADELGAFKLPFPNKVDQSSIVEFLDHETAKIDTLIAEQEKLVGLLKEKRQAVISHAVTKGLNPKVKMKDSGVEWVGEIPESWSLIPFRYCVDYSEGPGIMAVDFHQKGIPLIRISGVEGRWVTLEGCNYLDPILVTKKWSHFRLEMRDLLISASASMGTVSEVGDESVGAVPYTGLIRLRPKNSSITRAFIRAFVVSSMFSKQIDELKTGATIQHFGPTHLSQIKIVLPSAAEQESITAYIDEATNKYDTLIIETQTALDLLYERRSALISAAVTGQIDVRNYKIKEVA